MWLAINHCFRARLWQSRCSAAVELTLTPNTEELLQAGWAITWNTTVGAASSCDTFLITEDGPRSLTPPENWPLKRIRIQGAEFVRPDVLAR